MLITVGLGQFALLALVPPAVLILCTLGLAAALGRFAPAAVVVSALLMIAYIVVLVVLNPFAIAGYDAGGPYNDKDFNAGAALFVLMPAVLFNIGAVWCAGLVWLLWLEDRVVRSGR